MSTAGKPKILIVGGFTFSGGEGGTNYVIGLGKALEGAGFCVEYLAEVRDGATLRKDFREFTCHFAPAGPVLRGWRAAIKNLCASENSVLKWLDQVSAHEFHTVIAQLGGLPVTFLLKLHRLCQAKPWNLAIVVGEWQPLWQFGDRKLRHRVLNSVDSEIQRRVVNKRINHVIALSRFLQRYYNNSGCHTVLIPPLIDASAEKWDCRTAMEGRSQDLTLLFSGSWQRDRLDLMMEAVQYLRRGGNRVVLEFLGPHQTDIERNPRLQRYISQAPQGTFRFHGRASPERVPPMTASADFGVMLRDRAKWSDACFPSKVPEFQALGVPLLRNLTSNLEEVLREGENALVVPQVSVAAFVATVKRALALTPTELQRMKLCSLKCASTQFDYRNYADSLGKFIWEVSGPAPAKSMVSTNIQPTSARES